MSEKSTEFVLTNVDFGQTHLVHADAPYRTLCGRYCEDWPWRHEGPLERVECRTCVRAVIGQGREALVGLSKHGDEMPERTS